MRIKTKVGLGVVFLFMVIITIGGMGLYYLEALSEDSKNILKDNYETLEHTKRIIENCDSLEIDSARAMKVMEANLLLQEENVTEAGERELTHALRVAFEKLKNSGIQDSIVVRIRGLALAIQGVNMQSIIMKNEVTQNTADKASTYLIIVATLCTIAAFTFVVNFPGYVANPIVMLTNSIQSIANKNYEERLHFARKDEFEELAEAFNQMAEKLDEYEHSNLAKILFEKKRIETIINRMTDPVIGLDEKNKVVFANDQALNLLNLTLKDVIDHYAPDVAVYNDLFRSLIRQNGQANQPSSLVKAVIGGRENYFSKETIEINYTPTGEKEVVNIGQVIMLRNITSYKELDLAKTNFIATISHELKTPIASLQMCVKLLQDNRVGNLNEEQQSIIRTLNDEVLRLSNITNELLDLSQVETGNIKLSIRNTNPRDIINLATEAVRFQAERKQVQIEIEAAPDLPEIQADIDKTTWVLVNFLTNAIRYSPENEKIILTCATSKEKVNFSVEDHGPGIERKYMSRIFDKFFQVPGTPSGTGLGLAISKEFIEAQHGEIQVTSELARGSKFTFSLPVA
ncbi:MAG TPA: ATP-binding protein [Cyclobacteriaceae bacterium]|nr:ATP-binding protein [Cyclobacteriaceae bacterium]